MDVVELYRNSVTEFVRRASTIDLDQWELSTPCAEWTVRDLVNHIVYEEHWSIPLLEGATVEAVGDRFEGDLLGKDPLEVLTDAAHGAQEAVVAIGVMEHQVHLSFGDTPAEEYVRQLFADHLIHGWDLAVATGGDTRLDPTLVAACATWFAEREELYRQGGAIGPRVPLPDDADEQDRLLAAFGRDPAWQPQAS
jgi:uncharacterized protein (TIGR03086 family)